MSGSEAQDLKPGDKVRATYVYEGTFENVRFGGPALLSEQRGVTCYLDFNNTHLKVEVLEPALPQVGDVIKGSELSRLPGDSVVLNINSKVARQKHSNSGKWYYSDGGEPGFYNSHTDVKVFEVLYIPSSE